MERETMGKTIMIAALILSTVSAYALPVGSVTKEEFLAREKAKWAEKGWPWDLLKAEALFQKIDTDHDGIASGKEKALYWGQRMKTDKKPDPIRLG